MGRCVLGYGDRVAVGTITASSSAPTRPATNLQDPRLSKKWAATSTSATVTVDLGALYTIGAVILGGCNLGLADTRRIRLSTTDATGAAGDAHDSGSGAAGVDPTFGQLVYVLPADVSARYLRLDLTAAVAPQAGRLWAMPTFRPATNFARGVSDLLRDLSATRQSEGGEMYADVRPKQRGIKLSLQRVTTAEKLAYLDPLRRAAGLTGDLMVCKDPDSANLGRDTIVGPLESVFDIPQPYFDWHTAEMTVMERL